MKMSTEELEKDIWEFPLLTGDGPLMTTTAYPGEYCQGWDQYPQFTVNQPGWYQEEDKPGRWHQCLLDKRGLRREKNRQASARYRERKQQLLDHLEAENRRMEEEIKYLESKLKRGLEVLANLKAEMGEPDNLNI